METRYEMEQGRETPMRDAQLGELLRSAAPENQILTWGQVVAIVDSAPRLRRSFWQSLTSPAPMRYAMAPMLALLVAGGTLWMIPAQSEQVGTIVTTSLPLEWETDTAALAEVQAAAQAKFAALAVPQGELRLMTVGREGRDQLVLTMMQVDQAQAQQVVSGLEHDYPLLSGPDPQYIDIKTNPAANRLLQIVDHVRGGTDELREGQQVLKALDTAGLTGLDITKLERLPDGSLLVELEAAFSVKVDGHMQEELGQTGAKADAGRLLQAIDGSQPAGR